MDDIFTSLEDCERSLFVFDEVQLMPKGLLNVLVPFLDYQEYSYKNKKTRKNKSIFIFLSNTGSTPIVQQMVNLWQSGRKRTELKMIDFEYLITKGAFYEEGGFQDSDAIKTNVIDHYVPFLPLEESHVISCIKFAYRGKGQVQPLEEDIEKILDTVKFGPEPEKLYSNSGCKRIEREVMLEMSKRKYFSQA